MKRSPKPTKLHRAPGFVYGYHGCTVEIAKRILGGESFLVSENAWDWLGRGVYFWEYAPFRANEWAIDRAERMGAEPAVLEATIDLGNCLNLLDTEHTFGLKEAFASFEQQMLSSRHLRNTGAGAHFLDRFVVDTYCDFIAGRGSRFQTVRGCFPEGQPFFPSSKILSKAHVQVAVRNAECIRAVRMVEFT